MSYFSELFQPRREMRLLVKDARRFRLTEKERAESRAVVDNFLHLNPAPVFVSNRFKFLIFQPAPVLLAVFLIFISGSAVAMGAEGALPGDILYAVKVYVNEPVVGSIKFSSQAKAEWQMAKTQRRLEEAEQLTVKGKLTHEVALNLKNQIIASADGVEKEAVNNTAEMAGVIRTNLEATLSAHHKVLDTLADKEVDSDKKDNVKILADNMAEQADYWMQKRRARIGVQIAKQDVSSGLEKTNQKIEEMRNLIRGANDSGLINATKQLVAAQDIINQGVVKVEANKPDDAYQLMQEANKMAEEAKALAEAQQKLLISFDDRPQGSIALSAPSLVVTTPGEEGAPIIVPIVTIKSDKAVYQTGEMIEAEVQVLNTTPKLLTLNFANSCQVSYAFDGVVIDEPFCTQAITQVDIEPGQSKVWERELSSSSLSIGKHALNAEVIGYGSAKTGIEIVGSIKNIREKPGTEDQVNAKEIEKE